MDGRDSLFYETYRMEIEASDRRVKQEQRDLYLMGLARDVLDYRLWPFKVGEVWVDYNVDFLCWIVQTDTFSEDPLKIGRDEVLGHVGDDGAMAIYLAERTAEHYLKLMNETVPDNIILGVD